MGFQQSVNQALQTAGAVKSNLFKPGGLGTGMQAPMPYNQAKGNMATQRVRQIVDTKKNQRRSFKEYMKNARVGDLSELEQNKIMGNYNSSYVRKKFMDAQDKKGENK